MKIDIWQEDREKSEVLECGLKVLRGVTINNLPTLKVFNPKATKPLFYYRFKNNEELEKRLAQTVNNLIEYQNRKKEYKQKRQVNIEQSKTLKKGDMFFTSWGYDQTNYDYIVIMEVSSTGKTAKCQRTSSLNMGNESQCDIEEPIFCPFGEMFIMQIKNDYNGKLVLRGSYPFLHTGIGSTRLDTFYPITTGQQFRPTDAYSGH